MFSFWINLCAKEKGKASNVIFYIFNMHPFWQLGSETMFYKTLHILILKVLLLCTYLYCPGNVISYHSDEITLHRMFKKSDPNDVYFIILEYLLSHISLLSHFHISRLFLSIDFEDLSKRFTSSPFYKNVSCQNRQSTKHDGIFEK